MIKDLLKTMTAINNDTTLTPNEKVLLSSLILYHNYSDGYAYPGYEHLMKALSTNRRAKVSDTLKLLVAKKYITIKKIQGNKSTYYIHKHLFYVEAAKPVDSNGNKPVKNQIHISDVVEDSKVIEISEYTGFDKETSKRLLDASGNDKGKVIDAFNRVKSKGNSDDLIGYTFWEIKNNKINIKTTHVESNLKFNNFEPRHYNYDELEKGLLGQAEEGEELKIYA